MVILNLKDGSERWGCVKLQTMTDSTPTPPPEKTHRICINLRNDLWQKWDGHDHPSPPRGDAPEQYATKNSKIVASIQF